MEEEYIRGALFGAAFGDAMGAGTEFIRSANAIKAKYPPDGPTQPMGNPARVTDDTQMMIAVGKALGLVSRGEETFFADALRRTFIAWYHDPDNNRAPGNTCLRGCEGLEDRTSPWQAASILGSKGCGANMRVQPLGLLPEEVDDRDIAGMAQLQAAMTHGHPTGLAASDATAMAIRFLARGGEPDELVEYLLDYANSQREVYHEDWLEDLWEYTHEQSPEDFIRRGWNETLDALEKLELAVATPRYEEDPCLSTGEGWIAEEALATGLHAFLLFWQDPQAALQRAAVTCGDSDSIACLTGAFAGAYHGIGIWPGDWIERIEYEDDLNVVTRILTRFEL